MAIPKKIHYCWFGGNPLNKRTLRYIERWKELCPDFEFIRWDETNCDMNANEYVRGAYQSGKWAFVSDYFRLKALYEQGGVYLDTDVELLRPFGDLLELSGFAGFEDAEHVATCVLGAEKEHGFFRQAMELYEGRTFLREGGEPDLTTNVEILTGLLGRNGLEPDGARQSVMGMEIFPAEYFSPRSLETGKLTKTGNTYAKILCFQTKSIPLFAYCSALHFLSLNEIRSVKLHPDTICDHIHFYATLCTVCGGNLFKSGAFLIQNKIMIVSMAVRKLIICLLNISAHRLCFPEIKRCSIHRSNLTGRNGFCINYRCVMRRADLQNLFHGTAASGTIQIEICMICHVKNRCLIRCCMICNGKFVRFSYFIRYFHNCISRISLLTFCILNYKCNFVCRLFLSIPQTS